MKKEQKHFITDQKKDIFFKTTNIINLTGNNLVQQEF